MKTICVLNNRIVMSQDGEALEAMTANAAQYPGATVEVITDAELSARMAPTFDDIKAAKNAEINAARLAANNKTFPYGGKHFACDDLSFKDIAAISGEVAMTGALPAGFPGAWKATDNTYLPITTVAAWTAFHQAMVTQGAANFIHSEALKAQLAAATTPEAVAAIVW